MALELFINGTQSGAVGQINLYGDEPIQLNISVGDIRDISKKNSTFSQTFTIPADANNNILLNHIFNIGADSTFDPSKKTQCYILNDSISVFNGQFQLTKINVKNRNVISYECVVYGETIDFVKALGDKLLTDLDFSELDHIGTSETIIASWTASTETLGYYYPLIDYGYDLSVSSLNPGVAKIVYSSGTLTSAVSDSVRDNTKNWVVNSLIGMLIEILTGTGAGQIRTISSNGTNVVSISNNWDIIPDASSTYNISLFDPQYNNSSEVGMKPSIFKPAIGNKYLFDKIMRRVGFSYESEVLTSDIFKETIIPYNGPSDLALSESRVDYLKFMVGTPTNTTGINIFTPNFSVNINNPNGFYNNTTKKYTTPVNANIRFGFRTTYSFSNPAASPSHQIVVRWYRSTFFGGLYTLYEEQATLDPNTVAGVRYNFVSEPPSFNDPNSGQWYPLEAGESVWVKVFFNPYAPSVGMTWHTYDPTQPQYYGTQFYNIPDLISTDGGLVEFNKCIPANVKQIDYIKSIITMFNLMVIPDKTNPKKVKFIPRNDYYKNGNIKNWSGKVDHTDKIEETLLSEQQNRTIKLSYKADKDYYNVDYTSKTNTVYGEHIQTIDNEWVNDEKKIDVIFSPTPIDKVLGTFDVYIPKIAKRDEKTKIYGRTDFNLRFLRKNPTLTSTVHTITLKGKKVSGFFTALTFDSYPYCGHLDHPVNPTVDYNFGQIKFAYYPELTNMTENNLVETYWQQYLDDINDKNSKLIKCKIYLTPDDIAKFDYNDSIFIDGLTDDGGHYFNVNKITYIPTSNLPSVVELIKVNRKPTEKRRRYTIVGEQLGPVRALDLGKRNSSQSGGVIVLGENNNIGYNAETTMIIGNNNTVANNATNVVLINSNNQNVTESFTTIVGNSYFPQQGESYTLFNDIDSGLDIIINPFANTILNDIDSGIDAVRNIGGQSIISDIDGGVDGIKI